MMNHLAHRSLTAVLIGFAAITLAKADEGRWPFTNPPTKLPKERYGFGPTAQWLENVQKSSVRFNTGGSGSFVSPRGLVMTNHHVGSDVLEQFSTPEKNLLESGFLASTLDEELKCKYLELNILWSIDDVTNRVKGVLGPDMSTAEANTAEQARAVSVDARAIVEALRKVYDANTLADEVMKP